MANAQEPQSLEMGVSCVQDEMGSGCPAKVHRPPTPPPPFRFLDLPGELQNDIVRHFIVSDLPVVIHEPRFNRHPSPPPRPRSRPRFDRPVLPTPPLSRSVSREDDRRIGHSRLALMLACRKLYYEHWKTYYGDNMFVFALDVFKNFSKEIPSRCWSHVRQIAFRMPHRFHHEEIWRMLSSMNGLEALELWMPKTTPTDETVRECTVQGVRECKKLKTLKIRRLHADEVERHVAESDEALENEIRSFLQARSEMQLTKQTRGLAHKLHTPSGKDELK